MSSSDADERPPPPPIEVESPSVENMAFFVLGVLVAVLMLAQLVGF